MKGLSPPPVGRQYIRDSCVKSHEWRCHSPYRTDVHTEDSDKPEKKLKLFYWLPDFQKRISELKAVKYSSFVSCLP